MFSLRDHIYRVTTISEVEWIIPSLKIPGGRRFREGIQHKFERCAGDRFTDRQHAQIEREPRARRSHHAGLPTRRAGTERTSYPDTGRGFAEGTYHWHKRCRRCLYWWVLGAARAEPRASRLRAVRCLLCHACHPAPGLHIQRTQRIQWLIFAPNM